MGEERAFDGSSKTGWKAGEKGGNYPAILKICNRKWLNDGKNKR